MTKRTLIINKLKKKFGNIIRTQYNFRNLNPHLTSLSISNNSAYSEYNNNWNLEQQQLNRNSFLMNTNDSLHGFEQQQQQYSYLNQHQKQTNNIIYQNSNYQMFPQQLMNEPMLNTAHFAAQFGGQFAEQQKEKVYIFAILLYYIDFFS